MHRFTLLVDKCVISTLKSLNDANEKITAALQKSSETSLITTVQSIQLQKVIFAVGMFSIFDACLQEGLKCKQGFKRAKEILASEGELDLKENFTNLCHAINALKHGTGPSYNALMAEDTALPFTIRPVDNFFSEGDVSEVSTLIEVNDDFVQQCSDVIRDVSEVIRRAHPEFNK